MTEVFHLMTMRASPGLPVTADQRDAPAFAFEMEDRAQEDRLPEAEVPAPGDAAAQILMVASFPLLSQIAKAKAANGPVAETGEPVPLAAISVPEAAAAVLMQVTPTPAYGLPEKDTTADPAEIPLAQPAPPAMGQSAVIDLPPGNGTTDPAGPKADLQATHFPVSRQSAFALRFRDMSEGLHISRQGVEEATAAAPETGQTSAQPQTAKGPVVEHAPAAGAMKPVPDFPRNEPLDPADLPVPVADRPALSPAGGSAAAIPAFLTPALAQSSHPATRSAAPSAQTLESDEATPPETEVGEAALPLAAGTSALAEIGPAPLPETRLLAVSSDGLTAPPDPRVVQTAPDESAPVDTGTAPMPRVSAADVTQQIAGQISALSSERAEFVLSPVELGRIRFEITQRGEGVQIIVMVERPETLDLMRRNADQLLADLTAMGFSGSALGFGNWGGQAPDPNPNLTEGGQIESERLSVAPQTISPAPPQHPHGGGLDLRL